MCSRRKIASGHWLLVNEQRHACGSGPTPSKRLFSDIRREACSFDHRSVTKELSCPAGGRQRRPRRDAGRIFCTRSAIARRQRRPPSWRSSCSKARLSDVISHRRELCRACPGIARSPRASRRDGRSWESCDLVRLTAISWRASYFPAELESAVVLMAKPCELKQPARNAGGGGRASRSRGSVERSDRRVPQALIGAAHRRHPARWLRAAAGPSRESPPRPRLRCRSPTGSSDAASGRFRD